MLKEYTDYAKEKWNVGLRARAQRAGTPVSYERIVGWKGQPEADIFWGGEPALFNSLAQKSLLTKLEIASDVWESIPPSIGVPKPIPLKDPGRFWVGTALEIYGIAYNPRRAGAARLGRRAQPEAQGPGGPVHAHALLVEPRHVPGHPPVER
jgi:iron(III) transport system substrate-binding protein